MLNRIGTKLPTLGLINSASIFEDGDQTLDTTLPPVVFAPTGKQCPAVTISGPYAIGITKGGGADNRYVVKASKITSSLGLTLY